MDAKMLTDELTRLWEFEFPATCKVIAAVPNDRRDYKPDPKSRTAWELAVHLASGDLWFLDSILAGAFAWDPDVDKKREKMFATTADIAAFYQREFPAKLAAVRAMPVDKLAAPVDFFGMFKWPNVSYLGFANNHSVHHRGQLAAYLRAMGSKVPAIYGGSADEPMAG